MTSDPLLSLIVLCIVLLLAGGAAGMLLERFMTKQRRDAWRARNQSKWRDGWRTNGAWRTNGVKNDLPGQVVPPKADATPAVKKIDAADQLRIVMSSDFVPQALLNKNEARVFKELDRHVIAANPGWQVMAQVSLGEILSCTDPEAYGCINSKRVDLLLVDEDCQPRHAVEYQGSGHYLSEAAARDAVKKEALRRAGIGYHEVLAGHTTPSDLRRLVDKLVDKPATLSSEPPERNS